MITGEIKYYIDHSVLCWLATVKDGNPSVSPKEIFSYFDDKIIIANIASPQSIKNIKDNFNVCVSFIDIFSQKGFQIYGKAMVLRQEDSGYEVRHQVLQDIAGDKFKILSIIEISITRVNKILAPSYQFDKTIKEDKVLESAFKTYKVKPLIK